METNKADAREWVETITPDRHIFSLNLKEIWRYRDLLLLLMRRDILAVYKQTILGPVWFIIQPILTTITFVVIFSKAARLSTSELPPIVFYLSGIVLWSYFSECVTRTSTFFRDNNQILSKVYFPRIIIPVSLVLTNFIKFSIQLALFFIVYIFYMETTGKIHPNFYALSLPFLVLLTAGLGMGMGLIISSITTKYKDLIHLTTFGVQLFMFASTVIFPYSEISHSRYKYIILANPMSGIIEAFRYGFLGKGYFSWTLLGYDAFCMILLLVIGLVIFNSIEKNFADNI